MISAAAWIARGKAARNPTKYNVEDEAELERVAKLTNVHFDDAKEQLAKAQKAAANWNREGQQQDEAGDGWEDDDNDDDDEDIKDDEKTAEAAAGAGQEVVADDATMDTDDANDLAKYNLDSYDNDAEEESAGQLGAFSNIKGLQFYRNNDEDPYITMKEEDEDEDREELEVLPTDNLIVCAKTEDEVSLLEAYVYSSEDSNLYVHHDLMLPSFPLCLEWLDYKPAGHGADQNSAPGTKGNFIAVGTMDPEIEIWSMDVVEGLFPDALLGRRDLTEALNGPKGTGKKSESPFLGTEELQKSGLTISIPPIQRRSCPRPASPIQTTTLTPSCLCHGTEPCRTCSAPPRQTRRSSCGTCHARRRRRPPRAVWVPCDPLIQSTPTRSRA